jgi:hypothetical protein
MKKTIILSLVLIATLILGVLPAFAATETDLIGFNLINNTDSSIWVALSGQGKYYYLAVSPGKTRLFTVQRGDYDHVTGACGMTVEGTVDLSSNVQLRFMPCTGLLGNHGAPTLEKINLLLPPPLRWRFQFKSG